MLKRVVNKISKDRLVRDYECFAFVFEDNSSLNVVFEGVWHDEETNTSLYVVYHDNDTVEAVTVKDDDTFENRFSFYCDHAQLCRCNIIDTHVRVDYEVYE